MTGPGCGTTTTGATTVGAGVTTTGAGATTVGAGWTMGLLLGERHTGETADGDGGGA